MGWTLLFVLLFTESDMNGNICELENISIRPLETAYFYLNSILLCLVSDLKCEPGMNRKRSRKLQFGFPESVSGKIK